MLALLDQTREPFIADDAEALIAKTAIERLRSVVETNQDIKLSVEGSATIIVPLPARAVALIYDVLQAMSERTPISIIPHEAELTTQQAADYLNVSRPYLTRQIDSGKLRHRMVGTHRRVRFADLVEFERHVKDAQKNAMKKLNDEAARLDLE